MMLSVAKFVDELLFSKVPDAVLLDLEFVVVDLPDVDLRVFTRPFLVLVAVVHLGDLLLRQLGLSEPCFCLGISFDNLLVSGLERLAKNGALLARLVLNVVFLNVKLA